MAADPTPLRAAPAPSAVPDIVVAPPRARRERSRGSRAARRPSTPGTAARPWTWTVGIPALVAIAPLIYGLGAVAKWGQVREAGLPATDVLPLVPTGQYLALGAQVLLGALFTLPVIAGFAYLVHLVLPSQRGETKAAPGMSGLLAEQERLRRDLDEFLAGAPAVTDELRVRRLRRLDIRAHRLDVAMTRRRWLIRGLVALCVVGGMFLITPIRLVAAAVALAALRRLGGRRGLALAVICGAVLTAVMAERFYAPQPLPDSTIRHTNGRLIKGPLVAATSDAWHVVVIKGRLKSVPTAQIAKSSVAASPRKRPALGRRFVDFVR